MQNSQNPTRNIELIRYLFDEDLAKGNVAACDEVFASDVILHGPISGEDVKGIEAIKKLDTSYAKAFQQNHIDIQDIFAHDDKVIVRWTCHGFHNKSSFKGIEARNKEFKVSGVSIYRFSNGKVSEIWQSWDRLGLLEQIGEVHVATAPIDQDSHFEILKALGMEKYFHHASRLSKRERECLLSLLEGKTAKETAAHLGLSPRTVESYFENVKNKLDCWNKGELFTTAQILKELHLLSFLILFILLFALQ